jgi:hypothetical protein
MEQVQYSTIAKYPYSSVQGVIGSTKTQEETTSK